MLLPVLACQLGPKQAVPIMAIAALMANVGKAMAWWHEVDLRAFADCSVAGVPAAALGERTLLMLTPDGVDAALEGFFLAMVPARRWLRASSLRSRPSKPPRRHFMGASAAAFPAAANRSRREWMPKADPSSRKPPPGPSVEVRMSSASASVR